MARRPTFIDLFAGAGGLSQGLTQAGWQCAFALESDRWAAETFQANHKDTHVWVTDVQNITDTQVVALGLKNIDVVAGGPPCQGFSHSNVSRRDPADPRNSLFMDFLRWVRLIEPHCAIIENVPGLLTTETASGRPVIEVIRDQFSQIGYECEWRVLDAQFFGVPQKRQRLFVISYPRGERLRADLYPEATHGHLDATELPGLSAHVLPVRTLWDAISDLPAICAGEDHVGYVSAPRNDFQQLMRRGAPPAITHHEPMRHTARIVERFRHIGFGESEANVPTHLRPRKRGDAANLSGRCYSQNSRRQRPDEPCNTIVASSHTNFIHPFLHRNFTVRETMRIQSFPDSFVLRGKRAVLSKKLSLRKGLLDDIFLDQRAQIGNAVPPLLGHAVGAAVGCALDLFPKYNAASA